DAAPTAWQGVQHAPVPDGGPPAVLRLGPIGQLAARIGVHLGHRVIGVDPVPERLAMAARHGIVLPYADGGQAEVLRE
ncbi:glutathione-dependent formaldehyde dehydrogenase, partial [Micrococcus sp. SIMBA_131]